MIIHLPSYVQGDGGHAGLSAASQGARPLPLLCQGFKVGLISNVVFKLVSIIYLPVLQQIKFLIKDLTEIFRITYLKKTSF